jgi:hypothetical protein
LTTLAGAFESTPAGARLTYTSGSARCVVLGYLTNVDEPVEASVWARYASEGPDAIARLRGSFVIGVWDDDARRGVLATDHLGTGSSTELMGDVWFSLARSQRSLICSIRPRVQTKTRSFAGSRTSRLPAARRFTPACGAYAAAN